jgi:uncharacterized protein (TIGR02678 family)
MDYIILMITLMYLEDKTRGDKFILSDVVEYIKNTAITLELDNVPDWNKIADRKSFQNVMNLLIDLCVIKLKDAEKLSFQEDKNAEALYETMGISNYVMRLFDYNINNLKTSEDFIKNEFLGQDDQKGDVRRYRVFQSILYTPSVSSKDILSTDIDYIKKNRLFIKHEIDKLNMEVEITHNMAILYDDTSSIIKNNFPNNKKVTEIVLMINTKILENIKNKKIPLDEYEVAKVPSSYFEAIVKSIRQEKTPYVGKTWMSLTDDKFYNDILDYMQKYNFIKKEDNSILIYPTISRLIGKTNDVQIDNNEQISLFGGIDEL